jgi:hypothetical protein
MVFAPKACVSKTFTAILFALALLLRPTFLASQGPVIALKDVCPDGWTRYDCNDGVRLCTSPDFRSACESRGISCDNTVRYIGECVVSKWIVPEEWAHDTIDDLGFARFEIGPRYGWHTRVVRIDSSSFSSKDDLHDAMKSLNAFGVMARAREAHDEWRRNVPDEVDEDLKRSGWPPRVHINSLAEYRLPPPRPPNNNDVCPADWTRYSCELIRLCVSPNIMHRYAVRMSPMFKNAACEADSGIVPSEWTGATPHDVGYAQGSLLLGPRYLKTVRLDSSDIADGDIDEAIQRLVLVPVTARMYVEYLHGLGEGIAEFEEFLAKDRKKAQEIRK